MTRSAAGSVAAVDLLRSAQVKSEGRGERVFLLGHPRDALDLNGMEREDPSRQPAAANAEPARDRDNAERGREVQCHVREVIAENAGAPEAMFDPERGVKERVVLLSRAEIKPDAPQPAERLQVRPGDVRRVVPEQRATKGWGVDDEQADEQGQRKAGVRGRDGPPTRTGRAAVICLLARRGSPWRPARHAALLSQIRRASIQRREKKKAPQARRPRCP
jgi:hypothetical protein